MPNRIIKESIRTSKSVNGMSDFQFRLWVYLITYVDDYGRGSADPEIIKGFVFPRRKRISETDIEKALADLAGMGCITLYEVDGESYFCFPNWSKHQRIQTKKSKFPEPVHGESRKSTVGHGESPPESESESNPNTNPNPKPNPNARAMAADESGLLEYIQKYFGILSSSSIQEIRACLEEKTEPQLIRRAVDISVDNGVPKWSYCRSILNTWLVNGVKTLEAAEAYESRRKQERAPQRTQVGQDNTSFADIAREMEGESYDGK